MANTPISGPVTDWKKLKIHECCELFPPMTDEELESLQASIRSIGLTQKIRTWRGLIVDGRHRWIACRNLGIELTPADFEEWDGRGSLTEYVWALNRERRMEVMTTSQRAARAAELADVIRRERAEAAASGSNLTRGGRAVEVAAAAMKVSPSQAKAAAKVKAASPEEHEKVKQGVKTVHRATRDLGLAPGRHKVAVNGKPLIDVTIADPEKVTRLDDVAADMAERSAMKDADSDDAWVASLELYRALPEGKQRDGFARDAISWRHLQDARRAYAQRIGAERKGNRKSGPWLYSQEKAMKVAGPESWSLCAEQDGGCGGSGVQSGMPGESYKCPECGGWGFRVTG